MMCKLIDITALLQTIGAESKNELESVIDNSSPSLVEYSIKNLMDNSEEVYFNLSNIESKISVGTIDILFDYDNNCHIIDNGNSEDERQSYL